MEQISALLCYTKCEVVRRFKMKLVKFLNSNAGKNTRLAAGLILIVIGILLGMVTIAGAIIISAIGLIVSVLALSNVCLLSPLLKVHSH